MSAICPRCKQLLSIEKLIDLGADDWSDEVTLKTFRCYACPLVGVGVYEESRRGSDARWHHFGWETSRADYDRITADIASCPSPRSKGNCACAVHQRFTTIVNGTHAVRGSFARVGGSIDLG
ncbi:MAG: hypothetical protein QM831_23985 [Kofleriaceae bacterium]